MLEKTKKKYDAHVSISDNVIAHVVAQLYAQEPTKILDDIFQDLLADPSVAQNPIPFATYSSEDQLFGILHLLSTSEDFSPDKP